jgi:hypothetical protein
MVSARQVFDALLFVAALALGGALLYYSAILPNARKAERLERRGYALEREVASAAGDVERLRREVTALQSDPYTIERTLKRRLRELRPDRFGPDGEALPPPAPSKPARGSTR